MINFQCQVCHCQLSAREDQAGQLVRCPTCLTHLHVPSLQKVTSSPAVLDQEPIATDGNVAGSAPSSAAPTVNIIPAGTTVAGSPVHAGLGQRAGRHFGFNCSYCSSRLEATESMGAQQGQCPTCGNTIIVPRLDRVGRLVDPMTGKIIKPDPHPVHAYAAAGERAPIIVTGPDGVKNIRCPRCGTLSLITANNCRACSLPFTMEGTTARAGGATDGFCIAALVLGIIGIFAFCTVILPLLAIIFGVIGLLRISGRDASVGGRIMAISGIICGMIGGLIAVAVYIR